MIFVIKVIWLNIPKKSCHGETARRIEERISNQSKCDKNLHTLKHSSKEGHPHIQDKDFKVLGNLNVAALAL